jgi:hypothetical protein
MGESCFPSAFSVLPPYLLLLHRTLHTSLQSRPMSLREPYPSGAFSISRDFSQEKVIDPTVRGASDACGGCAVQVRCKAFAVQSWRPVTRWVCIRDATTMVLGAITAGIGTEGSCTLTSIMGWGPYEACERTGKIIALTRVNGIGYGGTRTRPVRPDRQDHCADQNGNGTGDDSHRGGGESRRSRARAFCTRGV